MPEEIRLVCPACDTVHRVHRVSAGTAYPCQRCSESLVTLHRARMICDACGYRSEEGHPPVEKAARCPACQSETPLRLEIDTPEGEATRSDASAEGAESPSPAETPSSEPPASTEASRRDEDAPSPSSPSPAAARSSSGADVSSAASPGVTSTEEAAGLDAATSAALERGMRRAVEGALQEDFYERLATPLRQAIAEDTRLEGFLTEKVDTVVERAVAKVQRPLLEELQSQRGTMPLWLAALLSLAAFGVMGLLFAMWAGADQEIRRAAARQQKQEAIIGKLSQTVETQQQLIIELRQELQLRARSSASRRPTAPAAPQPVASEAGSATVEAAPPAAGG